MAGFDVPAQWLQQRPDAGLAHEGHQHVDAVRRIDLDLSWNPMGFTRCIGQQGGVKQRRSRRLDVRRRPAWQAGQDGTQQFTVATEGVIAIHRRAMRSQQHYNFRDQFGDPRPLFSSRLPTARRTSVPRYNAMRSDTSAGLSGSRLMLRLGSSAASARSRARLISCSWRPGRKLVMHLDQQNFERRLLRSYKRNFASLTINKDRHQGVWAWNLTINSLFLDGLYCDTALPLYNHFG